MRLLPALVLLASCAKNGPPAPAMDDDAPIKLTFAWEPGWTGSWSSRHTRAQTGAGPDQLRTQEASGTMLTEGSAGGLVVSSTTDASRLDWSIGGQPAPQLPIVRLVTEPLVGLTHRSLVAPAGGFSGTLGGEALGIMLEGLMRKSLAPMLTVVPPEAKGNLEEMIRGDVLVAQMEDASRQRWWSTVEVWAGRDLVPHTPTPVTFDTTELLDDATVTLEIRGEVPCRGGDDAPLCVELVTTLTQDRATLLARVQSEMDQGAGAGMDIQVTSVTDTTRTTTVAEPATLRSWGSVARNDRTVSLVVQGQPQTTTTEEVKRWTIAWD